MQAKVYNIDVLVLQSSPSVYITLSKGLITWRISARAEISTWFAGLRFQLGFQNKSSWKDVCDYMKKVSSRADLQPGLRFAARFLKLGWKSQPGQTGWKTSCNHVQISAWAESELADAQWLFSTKENCCPDLFSVLNVLSQTEIFQVITTKFQPRLKFAM